MATASSGGERHPRGSLTFVSATPPIPCLAEPIAPTVTPEEAMVTARSELDLEFLIMRIDDVPRLVWAVEVSWLYSVAVSAHTGEVFANWHNFVIE